MTYYKVKPEFDNEYLLGPNRKTYCIIGNELYTEKELIKIFGKIPNPAIISGKYGLHDVFEKIEISRNKTYWFFGIRFIQRFNNDTV